MSEVKIGQLWLAKNPMHYWKKVQIVDLTRDTVFQYCIESSYKEQGGVYEMDLEEHLDRYDLDKSSIVQKDLEELLK